MSSSEASDALVENVWFSRLQEVLLMHRPFCFCVLLGSVELIFGFVYFLGLGIFSTIALLGLISFMLFIHIEHPNPQFVKIFFPPLEKPIDQTQPNRIRSYEEFSRGLSSLSQGINYYFGKKQLTGIKRVIFGVTCFVLALLLKRVVPFWVNFLLVHCILFLPSAILRPWPNKEAQNEEGAKNETASESVQEPKQQQQQENAQDNLQQENAQNNLQVQQNIVENNQAQQPVIENIQNQQQEQ